MYIFIHSSVDGHLGCFHVLAIVNSFCLLFCLGYTFCVYGMKAMAPHSSTLAWKIPWMEEPGRLQSMGSLRVGHDWATSLSLFTFMHWRRKWQPTRVFAWRIPGTVEPDGLPPMGSHRVGHDWSDLAAAAGQNTYNNFCLEEDKATHSSVLA